MMVAQRFHKHCHRRGVLADRRLPYGFMKTFILNNIVWKAKQKNMTTKQVRKWYQSWRSSPSNEVAASAYQPFKKESSEKTVLRSKARLRKCQRVRASGAGRPHKVPLFRQVLHEWWTRILYSIDWKQLVANRRSPGKKEPGPFSSLNHACQSPPTPRRTCLRMFAEQQPCANCQYRFVEVQKMRTVLRLIHARGEQEVPCAQKRAQRASRNLLGRFVQNQAIHFHGLRLRSLD